jgi:hypothetical protein
MSEQAPPEGPTLDVDEQGRRVVVSAGDRIELILDGANQLLRRFGARTPIPVDEDGTITLDEAGQWRYRQVGYNRLRTVTIYERVKTRTSFE